MCAREPPFSENRVQIVPWHGQGPGVFFNATRSGSPMRLLIGARRLVALLPYVEKNLEIALAPLRCLLCTRWAILHSFISASMCCMANRLTKLLNRRKGDEGEVSRGNALNLLGPPSGKPVRTAKVWWRREHSPQSIKPEAGLTEPVDTTLHQLTSFLARKQQYPIVQILSRSAGSSS